VIIHVARTGHALTIRADNGAELLMHIGIDTVELNGEGFSMLVKQGERVSQGQPVRLIWTALRASAKPGQPDHPDQWRGLRGAPWTLKAVKVGEPLLQIAPRSVAPLQTAVDNSRVHASTSVRVTSRRLACAPGGADSPDRTRFQQPVAGALR
jgi:phosphocarrier protein